MSLTEPIDIRAGGAVLLLIDYLNIPKEAKQQISVTTASSTKSTSFGATIIPGQQWEYAFAEFVRASEWVLVDANYTPNKGRSSKSYNSATGRYENGRLTMHDYSDFMGEEGWELIAVDSTQTVERQGRGVLQGIVDAVANQTTETYLSYHVRTLFFKRQRSHT
jgi:hypothetical protein